MYIILGLLNDGEKYQDTAHNIGGQILHNILSNKNKNIFFNASSLKFNIKRKAKISEGSFIKVGKEYFYQLVFPQDFINNSGYNLKNIFSDDLKKRKKEIKKLIVIYDDISLPFGEVKIHFNRGDGGHNGIKDIDNKIRSKEYIKIKIGVCPLDFFGKPRKPKKESVSNYLVNKKLSYRYTKQYIDIEKKVINILESIMVNGLLKSMNNFNSKK